MSDDILNLRLRILLGTIMTLLYHAVKLIKISLIIVFYNIASSVVFFIFYFCFGTVLSECKRPKELILVERHDINIVNDSRFSRLTKP